MHDQTDDIAARGIIKYDVSEDIGPLIKNIAVGFDEQLAKQLIDKSKQPNILKYTPNDSLKRFGNMEMLQGWLAKGRDLHWLLGENDDLAGLIWYGKSEFPIENTLEIPPQETFAIRLYDTYSGKGLAVPFMQQSLKIAVNNKRQKGQPITGIWLQTDSANPAAIAVYTKFGYEEVYRDDKRVTMVLSADKMNDIS